MNAIRNWMVINGEAIYATQPWKVFGEGVHEAKGGAYAGRSTSRLDARDTRFTRNKRGDVVYAIVLGWPDGKNFVIKNLGTASAVKPGRVENVELLGSHTKLDWKQTPSFRTVNKTVVKP